MLEFQVWIYIIAYTVVCLLQQSRISATEEWDFMVFAQQWPQSICDDLRKTHEHDCVIPSNVTTWSIHGLWPNKNHTKGPNNCNDTAKFEPSRIKSILPEMIKFWPNLYNDTPLESFWEHEWDKHGTCAMSLGTLSSELKYFTKGLKLNKDFDLVKILANYGIVPRDEYAYQYTDFLSAINKGAGGKSKLMCTYDKETKTQYIAQIEICVTKSFHIMDCEDHSSLHSVPVLDNHISPLHGVGRDFRPLRAGGGNVVNMMYNQVGVGEAIEDCYNTEQIAFPVIHHP